MVETIKCPKCGKILDKRGYGGHLYGVHLIRIGTKAKIAQLHDVEVKLSEDEALLKQLRDLMPATGEPGPTVSGLMRKILDHKG